MNKSKNKKKVSSSIKNQISRKSFLKLIVKSTIDERIAKFIKQKNKHIDSGIFLNFSKKKKKGVTF